MTLVGCLAAAALAAPAGQAVTIGPPLDDMPASTSSSCDNPQVILWVIPPPPPSCSLLNVDPTFAMSTQVPRGEWTIRTARVRTGPRVGPMVFTVIRATRSQAGAGGLICCHTPVESQVFTPAPNSINTVSVDLPVKNTVDVIEGEPIETVDYLGLSLLDTNSSVPVHLPQQGPGTSSNVSFIAPAIRMGQERTSDGTLFALSNFPPSVLLVNGEADPAPSDGGGGGGNPAPTPTPAPAAAPPALSGFDLARHAFRAAGRGPSVQTAAKVGTTVAYSLSTPATVAFTVERRGAGRKARGKCRKRTRANSTNKRCDLRLKGSFTHQGVAGGNSFQFTGRLGNRKLAPGRYNLVAKPAGTGAKATRAQFKIVAR